MTAVVLAQPPPRRRVEEFEIADEHLAMLIDRSWTAWELQPLRALCRELALREGRFFVALRRWRGLDVAFPDLIDVFRASMQRWPFAAQSSAALVEMANGLLRDHGQLRNRRASPLWRVSYLSHATEPMQGVALHTLLRKADRFNRLHGLSGALVHADGAFIQWLEGPQEIVQELLARIESDPRHRMVGLLVNGPCDARLFSGWGMTTDHSLATGDARAFRRWLEGQLQPVAARRDPALRTEALTLFERFWSDRGQQLRLRRQA